MDLAAAVAQVALAAQVQVQQEETVERVLTFLLLGRQ
jgi:hypothetical protein